MEFNAFLVKQNNSTGVNIGLSGVLAFFLGILFTMFEATHTIAMFLYIAGLICVLISPFFGKGSDMFEVTDDVMSVYSNEIVIRDKHYAFTEVSKLNFFFHSFYCQSTYGFFTDEDGQIEYGMNNYFGFLFNGEEVTEYFYIGNEEHANKFLNMIENLKQEQIDFTIEYRQYPNRIIPLS